MGRALGLIVLKKEVFFNKIGGEKKEANDWEILLLTAAVDELGSVFTVSLGEGVMLDPNARVDCIQIHTCGILRYMLVGIPRGL